MTRFALAGLAAAVLLGGTGGASAQYYGGGYYPPPPPPPYYGERYYGEPRYRGPGPRAFRPAYTDRYGRTFYYPGRGGTCPRGYTVQDGICKPYRGY